MALTRARVVSGSAAMKTAVSAAIAAVLKRPRDGTRIAADVREMRARIAAEKGTRDIWDIKQVRGGQVDLEFIVQYLQLIHAAGHDVLATNTQAALTRLSQTGLLAASEAEPLIAAARIYTELTGVMRLLADGPFRADGVPRGVMDRLVRASGAASFSALEAELAGTEAAVARAFERLV